MESTGSRIASEHRESTLAVLLVLARTPQSPFRQGSGLSLVLGANVIRHHSRAFRREDRRAEPGRKPRVSLLLREANRSSPRREGAVIAARGSDRVRSCGRFEGAKRLLPVVCRLR